MSKNNDNIMMYSEVAELLGINTQSVSQFVTKHDIKKGKIVRKGRHMGVVDRQSLMSVVDRLNYTGPITEADVVWE